MQICQVQAQTKRAEDRYLKNTKRRKEISDQLKRFQSGQKCDLSQVDDECRILVRARTLGMEEDLLKYKRSKVIFERILQSRDLVPGDFLRVGARVSSAVGRIHVRDLQGRRSGFGTGFMISDRLMITNNHVLEAAENCLNSVIEFDYLQYLVDRPRSTTFFSLDPAVFFITSPALDYTIVALALNQNQSQIESRGWLSLIPESGKLLIGERVNIIQHPKGGPQEVGLRKNEIQSVDGDYLIYQTDTEPGSSGSPVCNDQWQLAALHHAGVPKRNRQGEIVGWVANEGVRISRIVEDVQTRLQGRSNRRSELFEKAFVESPLSQGCHVGNVPISQTSGIEIPIRLNVQLNCSPSVTAVSSEFPTSSADVSNSVDQGADNSLPSSRQGPAFSNPKLDCIVVCVNKKSDIKSIATDLAKGWTVEPIDPQITPLSFDLIPANHDISISESWEMVHQLRSDDRILSAEASWEVESAIEEERDPDTVEDEALFGLITTKTDREARRKNWAPELIKVKSAWNVPPKHGLSLGEGIRIAHPDSGYTEHPELVEEPNAIDTTTSRDFIDPVNGDGLDLDGFHGTGTASVMISSEVGQILGVAPKSTLVPMRVAQKGKIRPAPILTNSGARRLRKAVQWAVTAECHVISISLGWFGNSALHAAVKNAWNNDLIIVAAAGNFTGSLIVWPARYRECICMAGCDARRGIWEGSARGSRVDFTGPAQDVWKAAFKKGRPRVTQSSGTSFATAMTAGVAALWLAFHGRDNLIDKYRPHDIRLAEVFRTVLQRSSDSPPHNLFGGFGGIINAERALKTPLPAPGEITIPTGHETFIGESESRVMSDNPSLAQALEILGGDYANNRQRLADMFQIGEDELEGIAEGCGDEIAFHAVMNQHHSGTNEMESSSMGILDKSVLSQQLRKRL